MIINADAPWIYYKDGLLCILLPKLPVCLFFFLKIQEPCLTPCLTHRGSYTSFLHPWLHPLSSQSTQTRLGHPNISLPLAHSSQPSLAPTHLSQAPFLSNKMCDFLQGVILIFSPC